MNTLSRIAVHAAVLAGLGTAAQAGPLDQGMVGGQLKSNVRVDDVSQRNRATLGYAKQELNVGSVNGGKVMGSVELNVYVKGIHQDNRATLGYSHQETSIGSIK